VQRLYQSIVNKKPYFLPDSRVPHFSYSPHIGSALGLQSAAQFISALHHLPTSFLSGRHFVFSLHFGLKLLVLERPNVSCLHQFSVCFTNWKSICCSPRVPTNRCRLEAYASTPFSSSAITYWASSPITPDFSTWFLLQINHHAYKPFPPFSKRRR